MLGRFEDSRMAKCRESNTQPWLVHSFRTFSIACYVTPLISTTLYSLAIAQVRRRCAASTAA